ncbi:hypothetical protein [Streptomyces sp. NPDC006527]|uniref:hypothetical protein n=1 Tax=Streptomyces sp. NPDC006527 TaxID=3364749 RepID=UPI00368FF7FD
MSRLTVVGATWRRAAGSFTVIGPSKRRYAGGERRRHAVGSVYGARFRSPVGVELIGLPPHRRGIGGLPTDRTAPDVPLSMREAAYHLPQVPDAPARLIGATADAVAAVPGEGIRDETIVTVVGVPDGRTGVADEVA